MNLTSTAMGSNATYQCRDGSSDVHVYTTQCTSDGVWDPNPNSLINRSCLSHVHASFSHIYSLLQK